MEKGRRIHIGTRTGAQIRSHAQKYFMKIQKEYPEQDSFEVFKSKSAQFLEDTIFMKNKDDSEDGNSIISNRLVKQPIESIQTKPELPQQDTSGEFQNSMNQFIAQKNSMRSEPVSMNMTYQQPNNELLTIRSFFDRIKASFSGYAPSTLPGAQHFANEGKLILTNKSVVISNFILNCLKYANFRKLILVTIDEQCHK